MAHKYVNMTELEVIDYVTNHLLTQGRKSLKANGMLCAYQSGDGLMCAAGCLMDFNEPFAEGEPWHVLVEDYGFDSKHMQLISRLQSIHDDSTPQEWPHLLRVTREIAVLAPK